MTKEVSELGWVLRPKLGIAQQAEEGREEMQV